MIDWNEMSALEKQLLSWTPRRPSAGLERSLFVAGPAAAQVLPSFRFSWLAPATAALMLLCVLFNQRYGPANAGSVTPVPMVAMILSNQSAAAYLPGSVQAEQNNLPADAFQWKNQRVAGPGPASLPRSERRK